MPEENIIGLLITREFTDNYIKKFTIQDLKKIIDNIITKHNCLVIKNQGFFKYLKYRIESFTHDIKYYNNFKISTYD